jgi:hypothetical protein
VSSTGWFSRYLTGRLLAVLLAVTSELATAQYPQLSVEARPPLGEEGDLGAVIARASALVADDRGEVYVLDAGDRNVKVFTTSGRFVRRFARAGSGPGELSRPLYIRLRGDSVVVFDQANGDVYFDRAGRHIRTLAPGALRDMSISLRGNGRVWQEDPVDRLIGPDIASVQVGDFRVHFRGPTGSPQTIFSYPSDLAQYRTSAGRVLRLPSGFGNAGAWTVVGDSSIVTVDGYSGRTSRYVVSRAGSLSLSRVDTLAVSSKAISASDRVLAATRIASATGSYGRAESVSPPSLGELLTAPPRWSVATEVISASGGVVWIGAPRSISRFDGSGSTRRLVARLESNTWYRLSAVGVDASVTLPSNFLLRAVVGDCFLGIDLGGDVAGILRYCLTQR